MKKTVRHYSRVIKLISLLLTAFCTVVLNAQILTDSSTVKLIKKGVDNIYNLEFEEAEKAYEIICRLYPGHPVIHLYKGMMVYWENYPLIPRSSARPLFEKELNSSIELCEKSRDHRHDAEYLLANVCSRGLLILFYADNGLSNNVIPLASGTYRHVRKSFDYTSECPDLYYFTGLYNYYREAYPRLHPVYKSLAFLFPSGDMKKGLEELDMAAEKSMVLSAEALSILSWIYVYFENNFSEGLDYSKRLSEKYPANLLFRALYIKNLLLLREYDDAELMINSESSDEQNPFYLAQLLIYNGILQEKKYRNNSLAEAYYKKGISDISVYGKYGDDFAANAYFGLSRICEARGDKHGHRIFHRKAMDMTDFKRINFED